MKIIKLFILLTVVSLICQNQIYSQADLQTNVHLYQVVQAWNLVRDQHPEVSNSVMQSKMQFDSYPNWWDTRFTEGPWQHGKILNGAYREDCEDVVYNYKDFHYLWWTGDNALVTATHFWVADAPYGTDPCTGSESWVYETPCGTNQHYENAYVKATSMWNGTYSKDGYTAGAITIGPFWDGTYWFYLKVGYPTLPQAYRNHNSVYTTHRTNLPPSYQEWTATNGYIPLKDYFNNASWVDDYIENMCWEVVGRICHLQGDMAVPAHAHGSIHEWDAYETGYLNISNAQSYTFSNAKTQAQQLNQEPIVKLDYIVNPIKYAFYLTNQAGDRFAGNKNIPITPFCGGAIETIHGNTNYLNCWCGWDDYGSILTPFYQSIGTTPTPNPPIDLAYCEAVANKSFVFSFRTTAGFLWYVYNKFILNTNYEKPPIFSCFSPNPPIIYGEYGNITMVLSQGNPEPNLHTSFWWRTENKPSNVEFLNGYSMGIWHITQEPYLTIHWPWNKSLPSFNLFCNAKNQYGETGEKQVINFSHSNSSGCPWLLVQGSDSVYQEDNNLLNRSKFQENIGVDISDRYVLGKAPGMINDLYTFSIEETANDTSFINNIKLYEVTHPVGTILCVTEDNQLAIFDSASVISVNYADINGKEITEDVQFHISPKGTAQSDTLDHTYADFPSNSNGNAVIANLKFKQYQQQTQKDWVATINISYDDESYTTNMARRENKSITAIPIINGNVNITNVNIDWYKGNDIRYIAIANLNYEGFSVTELPLYSAINSYNEEEMGNLVNLDSLYSIVEPSKSLVFKFYRFGTLINSSSQNKKDYVIEVNGRIGSYNNNSKNSKLKNRFLKDKENILVSYKNKLNNNYPNPFNPITKISYSIEKAGLVKLKIYDILGREIKTLVNEIKNPGEYIAEFNGSFLSSGVYFYRIECNGFIAIKKMVLIK